MSTYQCGNRYFPGLKGHGITSARGALRVLLPNDHGDASAAAMPRHTAGVARFDKHVTDTALLKRKASLQDSPDDCSLLCLAAP